MAFFAADTGIEKTLNNIIPNDSGTLSNGATFVVTVKCSPDFGGCPVGFSIDPDCDSQRYCIYSEGKFKSTKRAIETKY